MNPALGDDLEPVLAPVAATACSVEGAFLRAGAGLGRGLEIFEQLGASLTSLSGELDGGAMASATTSIGRVADELVAFSEHLPRDTETLAGLHACSEIVSARLDRLIESMRVMTVLNRFARIESAVFDAKGADFGDFTREIEQLTRHVRTKVETCSREHGKLIETLGAASRAQMKMEHDYRSKLIEMSSELQATFATIQDRRHRGAGVARDLMERSAEIANAVRTAIMSLQSGDSTRQRLEHVHQGVELTVVPPAASDEEAAAFRLVMYRLQAGQLRDALVFFERDVGAIDGSLERLVADARDLVALGRVTYGQDMQGHDGSDRSFLHTFGERLSRAAIVIGRCAEARASVSGIIGSMRDLIGELHVTISDLNGVITDVVLIGINAGLRAGRLGAEGRSLVVIAQELKASAGQIAGDAKGLLPVFENLQTLSRRLDVAADGTGHDVNDDVAAIRAALDDGGARMVALLETLGQVGQAFEGELAGARHDFARVIGTRGGLVSATEALDALEEAAWDEGLDEEAGLDIVDEVMLPRYTMAREREVHVAVLGAREANLTATSGRGADELEDLLF